MHKIKLLLAISLFCIFIQPGFAQESNQKLYRIYAEDFSMLRDIESRGMTVYNSKVDEYMDVMANPEQIQKLGTGGVKIEFIANNFIELIASRLKTGSYNDYHNHQQTIDLLADFSNSFPDITKLDTIGYSVLGRAIC